MKLSYLVMLSVACAIALSAGLSGHASAQQHVESAPGISYEDGTIYIEYHWPNGTIKNMTHYEVTYKTERGGTAGGGTLFEIRYHGDGTFKTWTDYHLDSAQPEKIVHYLPGGNIAINVTEYDTDGSTITYQEVWLKNGTQTKLVDRANGLEVITWDDQGIISGYEKWYPSGNLAARLYPSNNPTQFQSYYDSQNYDGGGTGHTWQFRLHYSFNTITCHDEDRTRKLFNSDLNQLHRCSEPSRAAYNDFIKLRNAPTGGSSYDTGNAYMDRGPSGNPRPALPLDTSMSYDAPEPRAMSVYRAAPEPRAMSIYHDAPEPRAVSQQPPQQLGANLVSGGSFEDPAVTAHGGTWQLFADGTAGLGWTVANGPLELQRGILGGASDGAQHAELDGSGSVTISQALDTEPGGTYAVSFDYKARPDTPRHTNGLQATWNGADIAPGIGLNGDWQTHTVEVLGTGSDVIAFSDTGTSDGVGTFLDGVSVSLVRGPEPTPTTPPDATDDAAPDVPPPTPAVPSNATTAPDVPTPPQDANLVSGGSFEDPAVTAHGGTWQLFADGTAGLGWTVANGPLELQRGILGGASDGAQHAELDGSGSVTISQALDTEPGGTYAVSFDYKARPDTPRHTNGLQATWNGADIAPGIGLNGDWQTHTAEVLGTGGDVIAFSDTGTSDGVGTFLDGVSVSLVRGPEPTPVVPTNATDTTAPDVPPPPPATPTNATDTTAPDVPPPPPSTPVTPSNATDTTAPVVPSNATDTTAPVVPSNATDTTAPDVPQHVADSPLYQAVLEALDRIPQDSPLYPTFQNAHDHIVQGTYVQVSEPEPDVVAPQNATKPALPPTPAPEAPSVSPDDPLTLSVSDAYAVEGDGLSFALTLNKPSDEAVYVYYITIDDTATTSDYGFETDMVTFGPGQVNKTVTISTFADGMEEETEKMMFEITIVDGARIGNYIGTGNIIDWAGS